MGPLPGWPPAELGLGVCPLTLLLGLQGSRDIHRSLIADYHCVKVTKSMPDSHEYAAQGGGRAEVELERRNTTDICVPVPTTMPLIVHSAEHHVHNPECPQVSTTGTQRQVKGILVW